MPTRIITANVVGIAACTVLASVYNRSPVGNSYRAGLDDKTAAFLQSVAWETVQDYYKK